MILGDRDLRYFLEKGYIDIKPMSDHTVRENGIDLRIGSEVARLSKTRKVYDIGKKANNGFFKIEKGDSFVIHPHEHVLMVTEECVRLPHDVMAFVNLRSSFARLGLFIPPTIVDAGFEGELTIEIIGSEFPIRILKGTRFLHLIFAKTLTPVDKPYSGRYQKQAGVTLPRVHRGRYL
jgi:dCTP deaminase